MCATGIIILRSIFIWTTNLFLSDPSLSISPFADLTDVTLAYEDTNSILTDNAKRAIQGASKDAQSPSFILLLLLLLAAMQVTQPGGKICK